MAIRAHLATIDTYNAALYYNILWSNQILMCYRIWLLSLCAWLSRNFLSRTLFFGRTKIKCYASRFEFTAYHYHCTIEKMSHISSRFDVGTRCNLLFIYCCSSSRVAIKHSTVKLYCRYTNISSIEWYISVKIGNGINMKRRQTKK